MRFYKGFTFVVSTVLAFFVFGAIALGIEATGLVRVAAPSEPVTSAVFLQIDAEEQAWLALGINNYRLKIRRVTAPLLLDDVTVEVHDGHISFVSCNTQAGEAIACSIPEGYIDASTIPELFEFARAEQAMEENSPVNGFTYSTELEFDATYHFPSRTTSMIVDPQVLFGVVMWEVLSFEPLP